MGLIHYCENSFEFWNCNSSRDPQANRDMESSFYCSVVIFLFHWNDVKQLKMDCPWSHLCRRSSWVAGKEHCPSTWVSLGDWDTHPSTQQLNLLHCCGRHCHVLSVPHCSCHLLCRGTVPSCFRLPIRQVGLSVLHTCDAILCVWKLCISFCLVTLPQKKTQMYALIFQH